MSDFYDRAGEPIDLKQWTLLFEDKRYQILRQDRVGPYLVSTVWLGIDHNFTGRMLRDNPVPPEIGDPWPDFDDRPWTFETMVFKVADDVEQYRYATEEEALAGHARLLEEVSLLAAL